MSMPLASRCHALLDSSGIIRSADLSWQGECWERFVIGEPLPEPASGPYLVPSLPVDIHCHGVGPLDLSSLQPSDLPELCRLARQQGIYCVPTVFLRKSYFDTFLEVMAEFASLQRTGALPNLLGFALEGPLLGNIGGTPTSGSWIPTADQWKRLAACGPLGLLYVVISPDLHALGYRGGTLQDSPDLPWIVETLLEGGVRLSLGHFQRSDPDRSARCIREVIELVEHLVDAPAVYHILTDHLFNDMPRMFQHAWRSPAEKARRDADIAALQRDPWRWETLDRQVGPVPAQLLRAARDGQLTLCLNFDGEHVDPVVTRATVDLVGADRIIGMTDRTETRNLAGHALLTKDHSSLFYQSKDVVAAGSQAIDRQMQTMRRQGLSEADIWEIYSFLPLRLLNSPVGRLGGGPPKEATYVMPPDAQLPLYCSTDAVAVPLG